MLITKPAVKKLFVTEPEKIERRDFTVQVHAKTGKVIGCKIYLNQ